MERGGSGDASTFNKVCSASALVLVAGLALTGPLTSPGLPSLEDFGQYYMAGAVVLEGHWEVLYPTPSPGAPLNAGWREGSTMKPGYADLATRLGVGDVNRFILPPPVALLFAPIALLPYGAAAWAWFGILVLCGWGVALQAGRLHEIACGGASRLSGLVVIAVAISPLLRRSIRTAQLSPLVALCIGAALLAILRCTDTARRSPLAPRHHPDLAEGGALAMLRRRDAASRSTLDVLRRGDAAGEADLDEGMGNPAGAIRHHGSAAARVLAIPRRRDAAGGAALALGGIAKIVPAALLPLALLSGRRAVALWCAGIAAALFGVSIPLMGWEVHREYFSTIAPTLRESSPWRGNQSLAGTILRVTGAGALAPGIGFALTAAGIVSFVLACVLIARRREEIATRPALLLASGALLILPLLVFAPIAWEHYYVYLCPLWGWLAREARGSTAAALAAGGAIALTWAPLSITSWAALREPLLSHMLAGAILMLGLAVRRLLPR